MATHTPRPQLDDQHLQERSQASECYFDQVSPAFKALFEAALKAAEVCDCYALMLMLSDRYATKGRQRR
jgi:hypothetical protein